MEDNKQDKRENLPAISETKHKNIYQKQNE